MSVATSMTSFQNPFIAFHLFTIIPVLLIGPFILFTKKGDARHIKIGRAWALLMSVSCLSSFGIGRSLSWLHGLAGWTLFCMVMGVYHARERNISQHRRYMIGSYMGAVIAFLFALRPSRLLGSLLFGLWR